MRVIEDLEHIHNTIERVSGEPTDADVCNSLTMAVDLLEIGPVLSATIEQRVLTTCGKCGAKAFKESKSGSLYRAAASTFGYDGDGDADHTGSGRETEVLDLARLVMQMVVFRRFQMAKARATPTRFR